MVYYNAVECVKLQIVYIIYSWIINVRVYHLDMLNKIFGLSIIS